MKTDTPKQKAVAVTTDGKKAKAARIKHLKDAMIELAPLFPIVRRFKALKIKVKGYAKAADITEYEIEEPSRVVLRWVKGSPNATKAKLLLALETVLGDKLEAQRFLDELMKVVHVEGKDKGKSVLSFKDRSGYLNIGES